MNFLSQNAATISALVGVFTLLNFVAQWCISLYKIHIEKKEHEKCKLHMSSGGLMLPKLTPSWIHKVIVVSGILVVLSWIPVAIIWMVK